MGTDVPAVRNHARAQLRGNIAEDIDQRYEDELLFSSRVGGKAFLPGLMRSHGASFKVSCAVTGRIIDHVCRSAVITLDYSAGQKFSSLYDAPVFVCT